MSGAATVCRAKRFSDMQRPGGGGSGGALPQTPGQKYRLIYLSAAACDMGYWDNSSNRVLASWRSAVSNPSVNQP